MLLKRKCAAGPRIQAAQPPRWQRASFRPQQPSARFETHATPRPGHPPTARSLWPRRRCVRTCISYERATNIYEYEYHTNSMIRMRVYMRSERVRNARPSGLSLLRLALGACSSSTLFTGEHIPRKRACVSSGSSLLELVLGEAKRSEASPSCRRAGFRRPHAQAPPELGLRAG